MKFTNLSERVGSKDELIPPITPHGNLLPLSHSMSSNASLDIST